MSYALAYELLIAAIALASVFPMWRLIIGPSLADRAIAFDALAILVAGILALFSIRIGTGVFIEAILILALLGFLGTLAVGRFIERGELLPPNPIPDEEWDSLEVPSDAALPGPEAGVVPHADLRDVHEADHPRRAKPAERMTASHPPDHDDAEEDAP